MDIRRLMRPALAGALAIGVAGGAVAAALPMLDLFKTVELGEWQLHERGPHGAVTAMCVRDPIALIQLRHPGQACSQFVVENAASTGTVHYTCPGAGHGRTTIQEFTPRSLSIETQGIANGIPFHVAVDGRRLGACAGGSAGR